MKKNTATKKCSDTYTAPYNLRSNAFASTVALKNNVTSTNLKNHTQTTIKCRTSSKITKDKLDFNVSQPTTTLCKITTSTKSVPTKPIDGSSQRPRIEAIKPSTFMQSAQTFIDNQITVSSSIDNDITFTNDTTVIEARIFIL